MQHRKIQINWPLFSFCLQGLQLLKKLDFTKEECQFHENYIWNLFSLTVNPMQRLGQRRTLVMLERPMIMVIYPLAFCVGEFSDSTIGFKEVG